MSSQSSQQTQQTQQASSGSWWDVARAVGAGVRSFGVGVLNMTAVSYLNQFVMGGISTGLSWALSWLIGTTAVAVIVGALGFVTQPLLFQAWLAVAPKVLALGKEGTNALARSLQQYLPAGFNARATRPRTRPLEPLRELGADFDTIRYVIYQAHLDISVYEAANLAIIMTIAPRASVEDLGTYLLQLHAVDAALSRSNSPASTHARMAIKEQVVRTWWSSATDAGAIARGAAQTQKLSYEDGLALEAEVRRASGLCIVVNPENEKLAKEFVDKAVEDVRQYREQVALQQQQQAEAQAQQRQQAEAQAQQRQQAEAQAQRQAAQAAPPAKPKKSVRFSDVVQYAPAPAPVPSPPAKPATAARRTYSRAELEARLAAYDRDPSRYTPEQRAAFERVRRKLYG